MILGVEKRDWINLNLGKMKKTEPFGNKHKSCLVFSLAVSVRWRRQTHTVRTKE